MTRDPEALIRECVALSNNVAHAGRQLAGNIPAITAACRNGLFIGESSRLLRERMLMAVAVLRRRHYGRAYVSASAAAAVAASAAHRQKGTAGSSGKGAVAGQGAGAATSAAASVASGAAAGAVSAAGAASSGRRLAHSGAADVTASGAAAAAATASYDSVRHPQQQHVMEVEALLTEVAGAGAAGPPVPPTTVDVVDGYAITAGQCWASQVCAAPLRVRARPPRSSMGILE